MSRVSLATTSALCVSMLAAPVYGQRGADWSTAGFDAQRSWWLRSDAKISLESMRQPGFSLVWKMNLNDAAGSQASLTPPVLLDFYISYRGFRSLAFVGASSDAVVAIDTDLARLEWTKKLGQGGARGGSGPCPAGMTASLARPSALPYPTAIPARGAGRGTPAKSGVGEPLEGAVTLKQTPPPATPPMTPPARSGSAAAKRVVAPVNPYAPRVQYVYALSSDGKFHSLYVSNGDEPKPGIPFLPGKANAQGLIVVENHAYVATVNGCGGVENGIWALDLESRKVSRWKSGQALAGSATPAVAPDGTLYAATARELVALTEGTLALKGSFKVNGGEFASSPVVFEFKDKDLVATLGSDGRLHIVDAADLSRELAVSGAADAQKPASGKDATPVSLASWQDPAGVRWVLAPSAGAIVAWKVVERDGTVAVERGWTSGSIVAPFTPIIVNGVVFALSSGSASSRAILYALDSTTGKELWNSGEAMSTLVRTTGGLAAGGSHVYVATQDGTQYAFGFPIEH